MTALGLRELAGAVPAEVLVTLPVLLSLLGAAVSLTLSRWLLAQRVLSAAVLAVVVVDAALLLVRADAERAVVVQMGDFPAPLGITLVADRLSALLVLVSACVLLVVLLFAVGQGLSETSRFPVAAFHPAYLALAAGVSHAFLTGDLFNLFVAFEVLLVASYVLMTIAGDRPAVRSGMTYVVVALLSSALFLMGIALVYAATGTVNMADLSVRLAEVDPALRTALGVLFLVVFGIKAAVFPVFSWLPDSYPAAPAPVTAVFAGLLTKVGVYAIIRTQTLVFDGSAVSSLVLWAGILTMTVGILGAVAQQDMKRMLSFTLVSHIGYMLFGLGLFSVAGLAGALVYVVHHIVVQTTLFLVAALADRRAAPGEVRSVTGLAHAAPAVGVLFFLPALSLAGIPPFSGFVAKLGLLQAGVAQGGWLPLLSVGVALAVSLLTLYALAAHWVRTFWGEVSGVEEGGRVPRRMTAPAVVAVVGMLVLTPLAGPLYGVGERASRDLLQADVYRSAVFPGGPPATEPLDGRTSGGDAVDAAGAAGPAPVGARGAR